MAFKDKTLAEWDAYFGPVQPFADTATIVDGFVVPDQPFKGAAFRQCRGQRPSNTQYAVAEMLAYQGVPRAVVSASVGLDTEHRAVRTAHYGQIRWFLSLVKPLPERSRLTRTEAAMWQRLNWAGGAWVTNEELFRAAWPNEEPVNVEFVIRAHCYNLRQKGYPVYTKYKAGRRAPTAAEALDKYRKMDETRAILETKG